jgi:hypothetical protein
MRQVFALPTLVPDRTLQCFDEGLPDRAGLAHPTTQSLLSALSIRM